MILQLGDLQKHWFTQDNAKPFSYPGLTTCISSWSPKPSSARLDQQPHLCGRGSRQWPVNWPHAVWRSMNTVPYVFIYLFIQYENRTKVHNNEKRKKVCNFMTK